MRTDWSRHWGTSAYFEGHPFLTRAAAEALAAARPALVGIDSMNIDDTSDGERPAHTALLEAGIPIVEHLRGLDGPAARRTSGSMRCRRRSGTSARFPVRAYAVVEVDAR